jgi:ankyrin repeat protein
MDPNNPMHNVWSAAKNGDVALLRALIESETSPFDAQDVHGRTPFFYACLCSQVYVLQYLESLYVANNTDMSTEERQLCIARTPSESIWAYLVGHKTIDQVIAVHEKKSEMETMTVWSAAKTASLTKLRRILKLEPELVSAQDLDNHTPLFYAAQCNHATATAMLLPEYLKQVAPEQAALEIAACRAATRSADVVEVLDGSLTFKALMQRDAEARRAAKA